MTAKSTIYIPLLDEAVDVWRPVEALHEEDDVYTIVSTNPYPEDEHWQFTTGQSVRCRQMTLEDGKTGLVAHEEV